MRVLLVTDSFPPNCGGSGWSTYELARGLRTRGHVVSLVQPRPRQDADGKRQYDGFEVEEIAAAAPPVPFLRNYFKNERLWAQLTDRLVRHIRQSHVDIIHAQHVLTTVPAVRAGEATAVPVVATVRDYWPVCYWSDLIYDLDADRLCEACTPANMRRCLRGRAGTAGTLAWPLIPYMRANLRRKREGLSAADAVIAVSSVIHADLKARAPELAGTDVRHIPNPVDIAGIRRAADSMPRPLAEPYVLYVGKLEPNKGAGHLVDLAAGVGLLRSSRCGRRWPVAFRARTAGRRASRDGRPSHAGLAAARSGARLDAACVGAGVSVTRPRVAQPRAARGRSPWRAHRGDGDRRHARHRDPRADAACCRTAQTASHATSRGSTRTASLPRASATARGGTSSARSIRRPSSRASSSCTPTSSRSVEGRVADPAPFGVVVLGRSFYGLHGYGGLERHLYDLVRHHLAEGWHVTVVTRTPGDRAGVDPQRWRVLSDHPACDVRFVDYRTFPLAGRAGTTILDRSTAYPWFGRRAGGVAAEIVASGKADVIYGVGASVWGYAKARRGGARAPLVFNPQGLEEFGGMDGSYGGHALKSVGYAPLRAVVRDCAAAADAVIATDQAIVPAVLRHLRVGQDRVHLDSKWHRRRRPGRARRSCCGACRASPRGRHRRRDGARQRRAARSEQGVCRPGRGARPQRADGRVGDGCWWATDPSAGACRRWSTDRGSADRVRLVGRVDDRELHAWYDAADLFVHPTRYEGSSLVTLEAMLHRRPVLATRAGGLPDKVVPGRTGWLTEPSTPGALTATLQQAFAERERWPAYGEAGRALLEEVFDWRVLQRRFSALYGALTAADRRPASHRSSLAGRGWRAQGARWWRAAAVRRASRPPARDVVPPSRVRGRARGPRHCSTRVRRARTRPRARDSSSRAPRRSARAIRQTAARCSSESSDRHAPTAAPTPRRSPGASASSAPGRACPAAPGPPPDATSTAAADGSGGAKRSTSCSTSSRSIHRSSAASLLLALAPAGVNPSVVVARRSDSVTRCPSTVARTRSNTCARADTVHTADASENELPNTARFNPEITPRPIRAIPSQSRNLQSAICNLQFRRPAPG